MNMGYLGPAENCEFDRFHTSRDKTVEPHIEAYDKRATNARESKGGGRLPELVWQKGSDPRFAGAAAEFTTFSSFSPAL
jgi:hypothetical protein